MVQWVLVGLVTIKLRIKIQTEFLKVWFYDSFWLPYAKTSTKTAIGCWTIIKSWVANIKDLKQARLNVLQQICNEELKYELTLLQCALIEITFNCKTEFSSMFHRRVAPLSSFCTFL